MQAQSFHLVSFYSPSNYRVLCVRFSDMSRGMVSEEVRVVIVLVWDTQRTTTIC